MKPNARKVRRIGTGIVCGFAGGTADAITLLERLELKLEEHPGQVGRGVMEEGRARTRADTAQLLRSCVELAKLCVDWEEGGEPRTRKRRPLTRPVPAGGARRSIYGAWRPP